MTWCRYGAVLPYKLNGISYRMTSRPAYLKPIEHKLEILFENQKIDLAFSQEIEELEEQQLDAPEEFDDTEDPICKPIPTIDKPLHYTAVRLVSRKLVWYRLGIATYTAIADCALSHAKIGLIENLTNRTSSLLKSYTVKEAEQLPLVDIKKYLIASVRNHCNDRLQRWSELNKNGEVSVRSRADLFFKDMQHGESYEHDDEWGNINSSTFNPESLDGNHIRKIFENCNLEKDVIQNAIFYFVDGMTYKQISYFHGNQFSDSKYRKEIGEAIKKIRLKYPSFSDIQDG